MAMQLAPDFREFLRLLDAHEVEYLLVGGYAVAYHGYPRATQDLDVWVEIDPTNARKLVAVLHEFGFEDPEIASELFLEPDRIVRMGLPPMRLEILTSVSGLEFSEASSSSVDATIDGVRVPVIALADLRRNKAAAGRPKDLADLAELPDV